MTFSSPRLCKIDSSSNAPYTSSICISGLASVVEAKVVLLSAVSFVAEVNVDVAAAIKASCCCRNIAVGVRGFVLLDLAGVCPGFPSSRVWFDSVGLRAVVISEAKEISFVVSTVGIAIMPIMELGRELEWGHIIPAPVGPTVPARVDAFV